MICNDILSTQLIYIDSLWFKKNQSFYTILDSGQERIREALKNTSRDGN